MDTIGEQKLWSFSDAGGAVPTTCTEVRRSDGHKVTTFMDLATKIAELQFRNRDHVLVYRGQAQDFRNSKANSSLKPTLFRGGPSSNPPAGTLISRFNLLERAEFLLLKEYRRQRLLGAERIERQKILRWAILQHYEVCPTPLLDVTQSLRIAASFASKKGAERAYVFVLGVPYLSGAITASAEAGLQIVRLSSVCPPTAIRPHIQEGYLLGEYPEMTGYDQKQNYAHYEIDFGRRLVAKFCFHPRSFWKDDAFKIVGQSALYPNKNDPLFKLTQSIRPHLHQRP